MDIQSLLQQYFRSKSKQLLAACDEAVCEHNGLKGNHREDLIRIYLNDILPKRFEISRGMVYGLVHRSHEADIVIWDSYNYPKLQMQGHSLFFSESVKLVLEIKTNFSKDVLEDILTKCESIKNIVPMVGPDIEDELIMINQRINSIVTGESFEGMLISKPHIATGAVIYKGGQSFSIKDISQDILERVDDAWPDIIILLEAGKVVLKQYKEDEDGNIRTYIELLEANGDSLLVFTASLLGILTDRSINLEDPFYLSKYAFMIIDNMPSTQVDFCVSRFPACRKII